VNRALVTGASGFVGRFAVAALAERGFEVHGIARRPPADEPAVRWHEADLLEPQAGARVVREAGASHLLHLAWTTEHGHYWDDPANRDWVAATQRLTKAFSEAGGRRAVLAGSCAQYDWSVAEAMSESGTPRRPGTLYGRAKEEVSALFDATAIVFFPYGPFERPERLVPSVTLSLLAGEEAHTTAGTQERDFVHVADCGSALAALLDSPLTGDINVGSGRATPVAEVARTIGGLLGREELLRIGSLPGGDATRVVADAARLRDELGFAPRFGFEDGLRDAVEWWRQRTRRR
jgi:nucleoside-diphosphate-sugar epimerase